MDNNSNNNSNNNFFGGFLLGLLVGAAVVFLLGTKKGKRIWKAISEDGIDNISNLLDEANKSEDLDEVVVRKKEIIPTKKLAQKEIYVEPARPKARRFFRGISRHLN